MVAVLLLLTFSLSSSSGEKCCETIKIEWGKDATIKKSILVGTYKVDKTHKLEYTKKIFYIKEKSNLILSYHPDTAAEEYRKRWAVRVPGQIGLIRSNEQDSSILCPSKRVGIPKNIRVCRVVEHNYNLPSRRRRHP